MAEAIERALTDTRPKARYIVGGGARAQVVAVAAMPQRLRDTALAKGTGTPS